MARRTVLRAVRVVMMMGGRINRHLRRVVVVQAQLLVVTWTGRPTQHCDRHRTPDGQQYRDQHEEAEAKRFH